MAKCQHCDYPYTTSEKCPNCGSTNPQNNGCLSIIVWIFIGIGLYFFFNSFFDSKTDTTNTNESHVSLIDSSAYIPQNQNTVADSAKSVEYSNTNEDSNTNNDYENSQSTENSEEYYNESSNESSQTEPIDYSTYTDKMIDHGAVPLPNGVFFRGLHYYNDGTTYNPKTGENGTWKPN